MLSFVFSYLCSKHDESIVKCFASMSKAKKKINDANDKDVLRSWMSVQKVKPSITMVVASL